MTTRVELRKIRVLGSNPSKFDSPIQLHLELEVFEHVPKDAIDVAFTWSPVWDFPVDQELDEMEVGPLTALGKHAFTIESDPPDVTQIPDPTGPTALIISLKYRGEEFLHIGYNVTVTCEGAMPDVFTSAELLTRDIGKCYPKIREIAWDAVPSSPSAPLSARSSQSYEEETDEDSTASRELPEKRQRLEE